MMKNDAVIEEFLEYLKEIKTENVPILSAEQQRIVDSDGTLVVAAGAGSGKTTVLSLRFMRLLLEGKAKPDEILTLTFTRKAGREMYERIYKYAVLAAGTEDHRYKIVEDHLKDFASATISTLDSFNSEIARTSAPNYGISRDFELISESDEYNIVRECASEVLSENRDKADMLYSYFSPQRIFKDLFLPLSKRFDVMSEPKDVFDFKAWDTVKELLVEHILDEFDRCRSFLIEHLENTKDKIVKGAGDDVSLLYDNDRDSIVDLSFSELLELASHKGKLVKFIDFKENEPFLEEKAEGTKAREGWCTSLSLLASLKAEDESFWKDVFELFIAFADKVNNRKKLLGQLSYRDIESLAMRIMKEDLIVRQYFKKKFKYIMIDEFQDNTEKQKELIYILAEKNEVLGNGVPEVKDLDPNKLFFVGDAKQSIYRFRGADVSVFNKLNKELEDIREKDTVLNQNFRSEPKLIDHFNKVFEKVFSHEDALEKTPFATKTYKFWRGWTEDAQLYAHEASFESLISRDAKEGIEPQIVYMDLKQEKIDSYKTVTRPEEAKAVANIIEEIVNPENREWYIPGKEGPRAPRYSDIAVLYEKTNIQFDLETQLSSRGVPYIVDGSRSIMSGAMANDLYAYMRLLVYRKDKNTFMAILRSPFVNISYEGMKALQSFIVGKQSIELEDEAFCVPTEILDKLSVSDRTSFDSAAKFFKKMKEHSLIDKPYTLLERIFYESGYWENVLSPGNGGSSVEQFEPIWNVALESESISDFLFLMELFFDDPYKVPADMLRFADDGVKLMTVHKSKGLDFPIVIVCNMNSKDNGYDDCIVDDPNGHFTSFYKAGYDVKLESNYKKAILKIRDEYCERAEKKRALYVALTRAKTHLVVVGAKYDPYVDCHLKGKDIEVKKFEDNKKEAKKYESIPKLRIGYLYREAIEGINDIKRIEYPFEEKSNAVKAEPVSQAVSSKKLSGVPKIKCRSLKAGVKEFGSEDHDSEHTNKENDLGKFPELDGRITLTPELAPDFGTLCHETLEYRFAGDMAKPRWKGIPLSEDKFALVESAASSIADRFFSSEFYDRYIKDVAPECIHPEFGFMMKGDNDMVLEGSVDLLVEREDCNIVVDYKTDRCRNPKEHEAQLTRYCNAMSDIFGGKKTVGYVVYLRTMEAVKIA